MGNVDELVVTLELKVNEVNTILRSLGKHPFDEIANLVIKIKSQGEAQLAELQTQQPQEQLVEGE